MTSIDELALRPTRAIVNLDALAGNVRAFRRLVPASVGLMAVVKANGYGHGAEMVARMAVAAGASHLGVATVQEGVQLRRAAVAAPILVLGPIDHAEIETALTHSLTLAVGGLDAVDHISAAVTAGGLGRPAALHLKIDTGMRRFGCLPDEAPALAKRIVADRSLRLDGVFTHFACADVADERPTLDQQRHFDACLRTISAATGGVPVLCHAANSAATLRSRRYDYDLVRIGIAMYGAAPSPAVPLAPGIEPVMAIVSRVARLISLQPGDRVSYGGEYQACEHERAALIPIGYGDGYRRALSNCGWMAAAGMRAPVRGRVCMDQTVIGLPLEQTVTVGDEVTVVGPPASGAPGWSDLAGISGTIAYEMMTGMSARVPRVYMQNGRPIAVSDLSGLRCLT